MFFFRTFLISIILLSGFKPIYSQDSNVVSYSLFMEKSVPFGTVDTKIDEGVFKEGESFLIPHANLPSSPINFAIYQNLYNALVGGRFSIDYGALNNDIIMKIFIRRLNPTVGEYLNLGEEQDTLFSYFEIRIWELPDSNFYPEDSSYYFNEGYYAHFSLPKSPELLNFLGIVGIDSQDSLAFAFLENFNSGNEDWNGYGIETIDSQDSVKFKAIHLSRIGGGRKRIANNIIPHDSTVGINIRELQGIPNSIELNQNFPNPFNPSTIISYSVVENGQVELSIYNILGEQIYSLINKYQTTGNYEIEFSANEINSNLPSGMYIYSLNQNGKTLSKKMILMK